jgi:integrase
MPGPTRDALRAWRKEQAEDRLRLGERYADNGVVFATRTGRLVHASVVERGFDRLCAKAGIGHWQLRELRHTYVSQLSHAGIDIEVISDAVGHKNSTITRTVYARGIADVITQPGDVMDRIYGSGQ